MNKKFLSAILFGALMVSSTGTFVSCKDYDDDIDELTSRVDGVEGQIKDLEAKINAANWITSVTPATGGFTVAFNDGSSYTITNGKDGEAGAAGTEWTISEDGFWVCNGEKTTVKAVGQDGAQGEPGKDAQPEVKKENGKWYLWNGTEFEEFAGATPATNVPYYYADPTDPNNYVIMVVCDKDGKNEKSVRLPLNEGLAQITVLENNFNIAYSIAKEGTAWPKWEGGSKEKPAKGEYMVGQSTSSIIVQISPVSYDLSGKTVKAVNSKGEELPIKLGKVVPFSGVLSSSRAASTTGLYEIPVEGITVNDEIVESYGNSNAVASLVVNENVYSPFNGDFNFSLVDAQDVNIPFGKYQINEQGDTYLTSYVDAKPGESVTIVPEKKWAGQLFDSYITMADNAQAKADSIRYGVSFDGMTINLNDKAAGNVYFTVHYMNVFGKVKSDNVTLNFNEKTPDAEEITSIVSKKHVVTEVTETAEQAFISDLKPYFDAMGADKRVVWNAEYQEMVLEPQVEWVYENAETGKIETENLTDLVKNIATVDSEGKTTTEAAQIAGIKVNFNTNYGSQLAKIIENGGEFTAKVNVVAAVKIGTLNYSRTIAVINLPFTIEKPSDATLAAAYTFNPSYYLNKIVTVYASEITKANIFSAGTVSGYKAIEDDADKIAVSDNGTITLTEKGETNKAYTLTGGKVTYAGVQFPIADFKVMFAESKNYTTVMPAGISIISGSGNIVTVKYGKAADKNDKNIYYRVDNISGTQDDIQNVVCEVEAKYTQYLTANINGKDIKLTANAGDANKVSVATPVKVKLTITTSTNEKVEDTITVNLTPYPAQ